MKSLIYVGMDVHKESYSLCTYLISTGEFIGETKIEAKPSLIKDYLGTIAKLLKEEKGYTEIEFQTCYEAGCLGFSLYKEMVKLGIDCKIVALLLYINLRTHQLKRVTEGMLKCLHVI